MVQQRPKRMRTRLDGNQNPVDRIICPLKLAFQCSLVELTISSHYGDGHHQVMNRWEVVIWSLDKHLVESTKKGCPLVAHVLVRLLSHPACHAWLLTSPQPRRPEQMEWTESVDNALLDKWVVSLVVLLFSCVPATTENRRCVFCDKNRESGQ